MSDWALNRIQCGGPYKVLPVRADHPDGWYYVADHVGTNAMRCLTQPGAVFMATNQDAEGVAALANEGRL